MHFYLKSSHGIKFTPGVSLLNFNFIQTVTQNRTIPSSLKILTSVRSLDPDLVSLILHYTNYLSGPDSPNIIIITDLQISYRHHDPTTYLCIHLHDTRVNHCVAHLRSVPFWSKKMTKSEIHFDGIVMFDEKS